MTCACGKPAVYTTTGECMACYTRRRRRDNPEIAERDRQTSLAWKERNRERNRARDREFSRTPGKGKKPCPNGCGGVCDRDRSECRVCILRRAEERREEIVEMYEAGVPILEIAEVLGTTKNSLNVEINRLRGEGRVGYRYTRYAEAAA